MDWCRHSGQWFGITWSRSLPIPVTLQFCSSFYLNKIPKQAHMKSYMIFISEGQEFIIKSVGKMGQCTSWSVMQQLHIPIAAQKDHKTAWSNKRGRLTSSMVSVSIGEHACIKRVLIFQEYSLIKRYILYILELLPLGRGQWEWGLGPKGKNKCYTGTVHKPMIVM